MEKVRIGDICEILNGYAFKSENYVDNGIRIIRIANVQKGFIEDNTPVFYPLSSVDLNKYMLEQDDLLMSLTGNVGRVALLRKEFLPAALNQRVACLRLISNEISKSYLFHVLNNEYFEKQCIQASKGVAQKNMSTEWLKQFEIPLYSKAKQTRIVKVLNSVQSIIEYMKVVLKQLDNLTISRFVEMFGDPVQNSKGWRTKPFLDIGNCKNGMNFHYTDSGTAINCLGVGDFKDLDIIDDVEKLPRVSMNEMPSEEYLLKDGDIVFVRSNGNKTLVGRSLVVYPYDVPTTFSGFCIRYRKTDDAVTIPYLLRVLKTDSMRQKMVGRGANIQNLNQQILGTLEIPIPPIELQNQFAVFVHQVDQLKMDAQNRLEKTQVLFDSLMQQHFG